MIENLKTPSELILLFPNCGYNPREIGYLLMLGIVRGKKTAYSCLIDSHSFEELLLFKSCYGQEKALLNDKKKAF